MSNIRSYNKNGTSEKRYSSLRSKIIRRISEWSKTSTSHGLPRIVEAKKLHLKLMWLFFLLVSISICWFIILKGVRDYLKYEVSTTIRVKPMNEIQMPVISICNSNPFVSENANEYVRDYLNNNKINFNVSKYFANEYQNITVPSFDYFAWNFYITNHPYFNETIKRSFSFWPRGFHTCHFRFTRFNCTDQLEWFYHSIFGNCFKFNSGYDKIRHKVNINYIRTIGREGDGFGIDIFMGVPAESYGDYVHQSSWNGLAVSVDDQFNYPIGLNFQNIKVFFFIEVKLLFNWQIIKNRAPYYKLDLF